VGLTAAEELRLLIVQRMGQQRDSGLGDLDEAQASSLPGLPAQALQEVLEAARALRSAAEGR